MKKSLIILFALFTVFGNLFSDEIDNIIQNTHSSVNLEDANALNVYTSVNLNVKNDYSYEYKVFYIKKILTYKGKKRYSDVKINYFPDYEEVKIDTAFTIDTNGKRIPIPKNMIYNIDTRKAMINPKYIKEKEFVLNFPQIEPGYYIILKYTLKNNRKIKFGNIEHLMETNPYAFKSFTIKYPESLFLKTYYPKDKNVKFTSSTDKHYKTLNWTVKDMPLVKSEPNKPSLTVIGCPIIYTFFDNWQELAKEKLSKLKVKNIPEDILKDAKKFNSFSDEKKIEKLYEYFAKNYSVNESYIGEIDFTPENPEVTFKNKYGSIRDIVYLFLNYAKALKIKELYPALILNSENSFYKIQKKYPLPYEIEDLAIFYKGKLFIPGYEKYPFGYIGCDKTNILYGFDKPKFFHYRYENKNLVKKNLKYTINKDTAVFDANIQAYGGMNRFFRQYFKNLTPKKMKIRFTNFYGTSTAQLIDGPNFINLDKFVEPLKYNYKFKLYDFTKSQDNFVYFSVEDCNANLNVSKEKRDYDFIISETTNEIKDIEIDYDKSGVLIYPSKPLYYKFKIGNETAYYKKNITINGNKYKLHYELYIPSGKVSVKDYKKLKKFVSLVNNPINSKIFIKKVGEIDGK